MFRPEPDSFLVCIFRRLVQSYCSRAESCEGLSSAEGESALIRHFGAAEQPGRGSPEQGPVGILPPTQPQVEPHWDSALQSRTRGLLMPVYAHRTEQGEWPERCAQPAFSVSSEFGLHFSSVGTSQAHTVVPTLGRQSRRQKRRTGLLSAPRFGLVEAQDLSARQPCTGLLGPAPCLWVGHLWGAV